MKTLFIALIVTLNFGIAWWVCHALGSVWKDVKIFGNRFDKAMLFAGALQSMAGFTMLAVVFITHNPNLFYAFNSRRNRRLREYLVEKISELGNGLYLHWYAGLLLALLGLGFIAWAEYMKQSYREKTLKDLSLKGYDALLTMEHSVSPPEEPYDFDEAARDINKEISMPYSDTVFKVIIVILLFPVLLPPYLIERYANKAPSHAITLYRKNGSIGR